ncbi:unnamed protein product [Prorocentrum cordatum]|uniref:Uncharacterized protein n=1 Tax=Prorocentrum cordatum TaxID=2364126 RepID=A0ABN9WDT4_9DINO|nr:unnamed protein product [Polarella glacialis]
MPLEEMGLEMFDAERPEWAKAICGARRPREGDDAEDRPQRERGEEPQGGRGGGRGMKEQELVDLTARLALVTARGLGLVESNAMETRLLDATHFLAKAGLAADKYYTEAAAGLKEIKKANPETDLSPLGPPFATVFWMTVNAVKKQAQGAAVDVAANFWNAHVDKKQPDYIATYITHFSVKQPRGDHSKRMQGGVKFQIVIHPTAVGIALRQIFDRVLEEAGAVRLAGSAPRGPLEGQTDRRAATEEKVILQRRQRAEKRPNLSEPDDCSRARQFLMSAEDPPTHRPSLGRGSQSWGCADSPDVNAEPVGSLEVPPSVGESSRCQSQGFATLPDAHAEPANVVGRGPRESFTECNIQSDCRSPPPNPEAQRQFEVWTSSVRSESRSGLLEAVLRPALSSPSAFCSWGQVFPSFASASSWAFCALGIRDKRTLPPVGEEGRAAGSTPRAGSASSAASRGGNSQPQRSRRPRRARPGRAPGGGPRPSWRRTRCCRRS